MENYYNIVIIIILLFLLIGFYFLLYGNTYFSENADDKESIPLISPIDMEEINRISVIPLNIFQTWHTKDLPPKMKQCVDRLKRANPEFKHYLYDDNECREFIKKNFDSDVLEAFDGLIPGAYKADLWRYCVLYKLGGIYLDIKFEAVDGFKLRELVDKEYFVLERPYFENTSLENELKLINLTNYYESVYNNIDTKTWKNKKIGLYNALMVCKPNNQVLFDCIQEIVKNVKNKYYGHNALYPTGPGLLGEKYFKGDMMKINKIDLLFYSLKGDLIISKKKEILKQYDNYRREQKNYSNTQYYQKLWREKKIYKE